MGLNIQKEKEKEQEIDIFPPPHTLLEHYFQLYSYDQIRWMEDLSKTFHNQCKDCKESTYFKVS